MTAAEVLTNIETQIANPEPRLAALIAVNEPALLMQAWVLAVIRDERARAGL